MERKKNIFRRQNEGIWVNRFVEFILSSSYHHLHRRQVSYLWVKSKIVFILTRQYIKYLEKRNHSIFDIFTFHFVMNICSNRMNLLLEDKEERKNGKNNKMKLLIIRRDVDTISF